MSSTKKLEKAVREKLRFPASPELRERLRASVLHAQKCTSPAERDPEEPVVRMMITKGPGAKLASVAAIIVVAVLCAVLWQRSSPSAYAIEQTVEALKNVRFMHLTWRDDTGRVREERWIEIGMDGRQVCYRQHRPPDLLVVENGRSTAVCRHDKTTMVIYDRKDKQYQWIGDLGEALENLRQKGRIIGRKDEYDGRYVYKVLWPHVGGECDVDPHTKLPIAMEGAEISYEQPPAGTFDIIIPVGYAIVDKRPGRITGPEPPWVHDEEEADRRFDQATHALAHGDCAEAASLFESVVAYQPHRNWAWFWLGAAYYELGKYGLAIERFNKVAEMYGGHAHSYCNYARALAYVCLGMQQEAQADLEICLPWMVFALREPSATTMFDYADNPLLRYGEKWPTERDAVSHMINRLRVLTGQSFGYDPDGTNREKEDAIAAWEQWSESSGRINFTPDTPLVSIPAAKDSENRWRSSLTAGPLHSSPRLGPSGDRAGHASSGNSRRARLWGNVRREGRRE